MVAEGNKLSRREADADTIESLKWRLEMAWIREEEKDTQTETDKGKQRSRQTSQTKQTSS